MNRLVSALAEAPARAECVTHVEVTPARLGVHGDWPGWAPDWVREGYQRLGVERPWLHQVQAIEAARRGHCVVATTTGSGKSLALWAPVLAALDQPYELGRVAQVRSRPTAIYLAPTKALAADQLATLNALLKAADVDGLEVATCDGDTPAELRRLWQAKADVVLTNPDFLHFSLLPGHIRWSGLLRGLRYVIVDELHTYRGLMGAHVAWVMRRLRRLARHYGADPIFLAASATVNQPQATLARLIGEDPAAVEAVTDDSAARGEGTFVMWRPAPHDDADHAGGGPAGDPWDPWDPWDAGAADLATRPNAGSEAKARVGESAGAGTGGLAPSRRSAPAEAAQLAADLVEIGARTLVFVRSRYSAEAVANTVRQILGEPLASRVATYRGGYLADERRDLERRLRDGALLGLVSTTALELGIDVAGLDAVITAGWPGTLIALKQQAGRAGRAGSDGLSIWVAGADPLDSYLVAHPRALVGAPLEATVFDPSNPYVAAPHLAAAAAELALEAEELDSLDPTAADVIEALAATGAVRRRGG
ncbi:MAG: DEAD/DEAH box helicase, partial [Bifidobacteriaceae bacterium]|nr:DEAD/DEAH box helicase [Bifidobacteriaceae bacterium]